MLNLQLIFYLRSREKMIDVALIGPADARIIGYSWYEMIERFYAKPENEKNQLSWAFGIPAGHFSLRLSLQWVECFLSLQVESNL